MDEKLISALSTFVMALAALGCILLNYRKDNRALSSTERKDERDSLYRDADRKDKQLDDCDGERQALRDENQRLRDLVNEYKLKEMVANLKNKE